MKRLLRLFFIPVLALAGTVTRTVVFDSRDLRITQANGYAVIQLANLNTTLELGKPMMPEAVFNVLIPPTATVTKIEVFPSQPEEIPGSFLVHPAQEPRPISAKTEPPFVLPDPATYASNNAYPGKLVDWAKTGTKSGWRICPFALYPLSYVPATGRLTLYRRMTVVVTYEENEVQPISITKGQQELFRPDVASLVINPEDVDRFAPPRRITDSPDCDYAIITSSGLASQWTSLAEWRTKKGYYTRVFRTDSITSVYPGRDNQEKIRNFIIDYFTNHGLKFVLLAGDNSIVPARRCRVIVGSTTGNIPSDIYYGDLQWSWDGDRDNLFGEPEDTVDLFYDVYVGRASVDNATQCQTFINKVFLYEKNPTTDYLKKLLLPYVELWTGYSGRIVNDSIANYTPAGWRDAYIANPTTTTPMRDSINSGYHFCHGAAHGDDYGLYDANGATIYSTSTAQGQTNSTRPVIFTSIACYPGNFETEDCLAEALMNNANGGAVAVIMNSRYGYGTPPSMGPSEKLDVRFFDLLFNYDTVDIGAAHARSKEFYVYSALSQTVWRWCYYELNLFGDPNMPMWKDVPGTMTVANRDTTTTGAQSFQVTVTSGGSPVSGALVCLYKPGEVHATGWTGSNGVANITINPLTPGTMFLTVTARQKRPVEKTVVVIPGAPQPYISILRYYIDDGNNHQLEPGESADLFVTLKNIGNAQATNVQGRLRTASSYITMTDSSSSYGNLNANDTSRGDRYRITASGSTPPGTVVNFTVHVTSSEGTWDPTFAITVGTPPQPGAVCLDHDTGYCKLSVTALGSIGFTEPPSLDLGSGFCYPKVGASQLFYSSFLVGNSPSYVADRFYSQPPTNPPNQDFRIVDSLRPVLPPGTGDEHFRTVYRDGGHPAPKNIRIVQHSFQNAASGYDDFVVITYDIWNDGSSPVTGLYAGIISDFDIGSNATSNTAGSDTVRRCVYMRQSSTANPTVGMKILAPRSFANLSAVDHDRYVYPDSCMTDGQKFRFLNGTIVQRSSNRTYDWSVMASVGPFDLNPGASYHAAFAFVGGTSVNEFTANADSAQSWYDRYVAIAEEQGPQNGRPGARIVCIPNPFRHVVHISYQVPVAGRVRAQVFDISGRAVATLVNADMPAGRSELNWDASNLACGVYLLKVTVPTGTMTEKLIVRR
ncbi:MAG: C25 family cysteine peptidase [candidate division WOR-3 bacterium]